MKKRIVFFLIFLAVIFSGVQKAEAAKNPKLNKKSVTMIKLHQDLLLDYDEYMKHPVNEYTLFVKNQIKKSNYRWKTNNANVVKIASGGKTSQVILKATGKGKTTVTCTIRTPKNKKITLKCKVKVKYPAADIKITSDSAKIENMSCKLMLGQNYQFGTKVTAPDTSDQVYWSIRDEDIASVSAEGFVTPLKVGRTVLKVTAAPKNWNQEKESKIIYAIVLDIDEKTASVDKIESIKGSNGYYAIKITFSEPILESSIIGENKLPINMKIGATKGARAPGDLTASLSADKRILTVEASKGFYGTYDVEIFGISAVSGLNVANHKETIKIEGTDGNSTGGATLLSITRTSTSTITASFSKAVTNPGTMTVNNSTLTNLYGIRTVYGTIDSSDSSKINYTLDVYMQQLTGSQAVTLSGYVCSGDKSGVVNSMTTNVNFTINGSSNNTNTPDVIQQLPAPSNIQQDTSDNNKVMIIFNQQIDESSALSTGNYQFSNGARVESVEITSNTDSGAVITLTLVQGSIINDQTQTTVTISGIKGYNGSFTVMAAATLNITLRENVKPVFLSATYNSVTKQIILTFSETIVGSPALDITANGASVSYQDIELKNNTLVITLLEAPAASTVVTITPLTNNVIQDNAGNKADFNAVNVTVQ